MQGCAANLKSDPKISQLQMDEELVYNCISKLRWYIDERQYQGDMNHWEKFVREHYNFNCVEMWCFQFCNINILNMPYYNDLEYGHCMICGGRSPAQFEATTRSLPRVWKCKFENGLISDFINFCSPQAKIMANGNMLLLDDKVVRKMEYQHFSIFYRGKIRVVFPNDKAAEILSLDFCTESFELRVPSDYVPLQSEVGIYEGYATLTPEMFNAYRDHHNFDVNSYIDITCGLPISFPGCFLLELLEHRNSQMEKAIAEHCISQLTLLYNHEQQHHASAMDYWENFFDSHAIERLCFSRTRNAHLITTSDLAPDKCSFCDSSKIYEAKGSELPDTMITKYTISGLVSDTFKFRSPKGKLIPCRRFLLHDEDTIRKMVYEHFAVFYFGKFRMLLLRDSSKIYSLEFCVESFEIRVPLDRMSEAQSSCDGYGLLDEENLNSYLANCNVDIHSHLHRQCSLPRGYPGSFLNAYAMRAPMSDIIPGDANQALLSLCRNLNLKTPIEAEIQMQPQLGHEKLQEYKSIITNYTNQQPFQNAANIGHWTNLVEKHFDVGGFEKLCFASCRVIDIFDIPYFSISKIRHCKICRSLSRVIFESNARSLPRVLKSKFRSGLQGDFIKFRVPQAKTLENGSTLLVDDGVVRTMKYQHFAVFYVGKLRVVFAENKKILAFEFCCEDVQIGLPPNDDVQESWVGDEGYILFKYSTRFSASLNIDSHVEYSCGLPHSHPGIFQNITDTDTGSSSGAAAKRIRN